LGRSTQALILSRVLPIGFLVLIITVGISLWLTARLVDPLRKLAHAATLIGSGNWDESLSSTGETSVAAKRDDEIGELARSFQGMSEQLKISFGNLERSNAALRLVQDELQSTNEGLEQRVIARTQEMAAFYDVTLLTSESQDMSDLLEPALSRILDIGKCQAASIHLITEDQSSLHLVARQGLVSIEIDQVQTLAIQLEYQSDVSQSGDPILGSGLMDSAAMPKELGLERFHTYLGAQLRARGSSLGLLSCFRESEERFSVNEISLIVALAEQLGIAVENHPLNQSTREMAVLEERERLARDMHDSVTQSLYGLNLFARSGQKAVEEGDDERLANSLSQIQEHSMTALNEMRLSLYQLQPTIVENEGLAQALEGRLDSVERRLGIEANLEARTEFLAGQLDFETTPGGGTTVTVVIGTTVEGRQL
jgi:nitrate/nitrite-specific signal transduction histidine kinase